MTRVLCVAGLNTTTCRRNEVSAQPANNSLQNTPLHHMSATGHHRHLSAVMSTDIDSDTNSHCALLIPEDALKQGNVLRQYGYLRHLLQTAVYTVYTTDLRLQY